MTSKEDNFEKVLLHETFKPHTDRERFVAFLLLSRKYPNLSYWSHNGYDCDALVDYTLKVVWNKNTVVTTDSNIEIKQTPKSFYDCSVTEIVDTWRQLVEELESE